MALRNALLQRDDALQQRVILAEAVVEVIPTAVQTSNKDLSEVTAYPP